jgi:hypothetical protein
VSRPHGYRRRRSGGAQIVCRGFAGPAIGYNVEQNLLSFVEAVHPGTFDGADVHEDILAAVIRLDKAEAFLAVEPLYRTLRHMTPLSGACLGRPHSRGPIYFRVLEEGRQSDADCAAGPSRSAEARSGTNRAWAGGPQGRQGLMPKRLGICTRPLFW